MMAGDAMAVVEAGAEPCGEACDPLLACPEWTMPAGWLTLLVALTLGACAAAGLLA